MSHLALYFLGPPRLELDGDFLAEFIGVHSSTLPRRSMRRAKRVGGLRRMSRVTFDKSTPVGYNAVSNIQETDRCFTTIRA